MRIAGNAAAAVLAHARAEAPRECCGLLIGTAIDIVHAVAARNLSERAETRYLIDPVDHLRAVRDARTRGLDVIGAYHSHPRSPAVPSATDAAEGFADFLFLIVGLAGDAPELTLWRWADGNFTAVPLVRLS